MTLELKNDKEVNKKHNKKLKPYYRIIHQISDVTLLYLKLTALIICPD